MSLKKTKNAVEFLANLFHPCGCCYVSLILARISYQWLLKGLKKQQVKKNYLAGKRQRRRVPKDNHAKCQGPFYNTWVHIEMSRRSLRPTLLSTRRFGSHVDRSGSFFFSSPRSLTFFIHAVGPDCAVGGVEHPSSQNPPSDKIPL